MRTDVDLKLVGRVANLPLESSPIQLNSEGVYGGKPFHVIGRILYEWEQGIWNEWHILFNDGSSGWLADAQLEFDVSFRIKPPEILPAATEVRGGRQFFWFKTRYEITSLTRAHYRGVEGELPFEYWNKSDVLFADLRTTDGHFGTIDYSEPQPLLFLGEATDFETLKLRNLRTFEGWKQ